MKISNFNAVKRHDPQTEESARLGEVRRRLQRAVRNIDERLSRYQEEIQAQKTYLWESKADMDHVEKVSTRQSIEQMLRTGDTLLVQKRRLLKLGCSPYFGRFDFTRTGRVDPEPFYIGIHHFHDEQENEHLVYDWRAPVAVLFYDFEMGPTA